MNKNEFDKLTSDELLKHALSLISGDEIQKDIKRGFELLIRAAQLGNADAQCDLGHCYRQGEVTEKNETEAFSWYRKAAEQGYARGQYNLGLCYANGIGVEKNNEDAVRWIREAAKQGSTIAQNWLDMGCILDYYNEFGVTGDKDIDRNIEWFKKKAELGSVIAQYIVGCLYYHVVLDKYEAVLWFRKAAEHGNSYAQNDLAYCYLEGIGIEKNDSLSFFWYKKAAEQGYAVAQYNLGRCYKKGIGVDKNEAKAVSLYRESATQGYADAQCNLGYCYSEGTGVIKNHEEALLWFRKAATQGQSIAQCFLGLYYENGYGTEKNEEEAVNWYRKAAEQGLCVAQYAMGVCFDNGIGVDKNAEEAFIWYGKAAEQDFPNAQCALGVCYKTGYGIKKNLVEAIKWFTKAAEQNYSDAQFFLGECYYNGTGVGQDTVEAIKWFRIAASQGNVQAMDAISSIKSNEGEVKQNQYEKRTKRKTTKYINVKFCLTNYIDILREYSILNDETEHRLNDIIFQGSTYKFPNSYDSEKDQFCLCSEIDKYNYFCDLISRMVYTKQVEGGKNKSSLINGNSYSAMVGRLIAQYYTDGFEAYENFFNKILSSVESSDFDSIMSELENTSGFRVNGEIRKEKKLVAYMLYSFNLDNLVVCNVYRDSNNNECVEYDSDRKVTLSVRSTGVYDMFWQIACADLENSYSRFVQDFNFSQYHIWIQNNWPISSYIDSQEYRTYDGDQEENIFEKGSFKVPRWYSLESFVTRLIEIYLKSQENAKASDLSEISSDKKKIKGKLQIEEVSRDKKLSDEAKYMNNLSSDELIPYLYQLLGLGIAVATNKNETHEKNLESDTMRLLQQTMHNLFNVNNMNLKW